MYYQQVLQGKKSNKKNGMLLWVTQSDNILKELLFILYFIFLLYICYFSNFYMIDFQEIKEIIILD